MANNVAKGSVKIGLDDAALRTALNTLATLAKQKGDEIAKNLEAGTKKKGGLFSGDNLKAGGGALAGVAGIAVGLGKAAEGVIKLDGADIRLNRSLEESQRLSDKWLESFMSRLDESKAKLESMKEVLGTALGRDEIAKQLGDVGKELSGTASGMARAKKEMEELDSVWKDFGKDSKNGYDRFKNLSVYLAGWTGSGESMETLRQKAKTSFDERRQQYDVLQKRETELKKLQNKLDDPSTNNDAQAAMRAYNTELEDSVAKLNRVTDEELKRKKLMEQFGFKEADFLKTNALIRQKNFLEGKKINDDYITGLDEAIDKLRGMTDEEVRQKKLINENGMKEADFLRANLRTKLKTSLEGKKLTDELTESIARQALAMEKTTEEAQLEELVKKGLDAKSAARIRQLIELKKEEAQQYKGLQAIEKDTWDFYKMQNERASNDAKMNRIKNDKGVADMIKKLEEIRKAIETGKAIVI